MKWTDRLRRHLPCFILPVAPKYPPKNITRWDVLWVVTFTFLGYFGSLVVAKKGNISITEFICWDFTAFGVSVFFSVLSIIIVQIKNINRSISAALRYTLDQANKENYEQRKKALQTVLMYSRTPCKVLRKYLDSDSYEDFNTDTIEGEMKNTHSMYAVNSYDIIPKCQLDDESVKKYLDTQKQLVEGGSLAVERLFRVKAKGIPDMLKSKGNDWLTEFISTIREHEIFKAKIHLYTDKNPVNTFLDYTIAYQKARTVIFITDTDELFRHKRYTGIKTSDPAIMEILLIDRFDPRPTAVEKRYTSDEFIGKAMSFLRKP